VTKLLFLGSSCIYRIYPRDCPQPIREEYLLIGPLEPTNETYALAKIAGVKLCQAYRRQHGADFVSTFNLASSHVVPALMRKMHEAKIKSAGSVTIWGTGTPRREFLHAGDLADACVFLLRHHAEEMLINVGCGQDLTVAELTELIREVVGFGGELAFDTTKPDGTLRKLLDIPRLANLGWRPRIGLREGPGADIPVGSGAAEVCPGYIGSVNEPTQYHKKSTTLSQVWPFV
jgi:GDP-L-fucose synthase